MRNELIQNLSKMKILDRKNGKNYAILFDIFSEGLGLCVAVCVRNAHHRKTQQNTAKLVSYLYFWERRKELLYDQNPALTYPFTYPFLLSQDIFYLQIRYIIASKKYFNKPKNFFKKISFRGPPAPSSSGVGLFLRPPNGETSSDVAVAWWSRPDEPASRN